MNERWLWQGIFKMSSKKTFSTHQQPKKRDMVLWVETIGARRVKDEGNQRWGEVGSGHRTGLGHLRRRHIVFPEGWDGGGRPVFLTVHFFNVKNVKNKKATKTKPKYPTTILEWRFFQFFGLIGNAWIWLRFWKMWGIFFVPVFYQYISEDTLFSSSSPPHPVDPSPDRIIGGRDLWVGKIFRTEEMCE